MTNRINSLFDKEGYIYRLYHRFRWLVRNQKHLQNLDDEVVATLQTFEKIKKNPPTFSIDTVLPLPKTFFISSGQYSFYNHVYNCSTPGVYRFSKPQKNNAQRILLDPSDAVLNALHLSLIALRGNSDNNKTIHELSCVASTRFLSVTCSPLVRFVASLMQDNGFDCRPVWSHTLDSLNTYNNGHTLLEVWQNSLQQYLVVDLDKKCMFTSRGKPLSLYELSRAYNLGLPIEYKLATPLAMVDWSSFIESKTDFNYQFIEHEIYLSQQGYQQCLARICQLPLITEGNNTYTCCWTDDDRKKAIAINSHWKYLSPDAFLTRFYPGKKLNGSMP